MKKIIMILLIATLSFLMLTSCNNQSRDINTYEEIIHLSDNIKTSLVAFNVLVYYDFELGYVISQCHILIDKCEELHMMDKIGDRRYYPTSECPYIIRHLNYISENTKYKCIINN